MAYSKKMQMTCKSASETSVEALNVYHTTRVSDLLDARLTDRGDAVSSIHRPRLPLGRVLVLFPGGISVEPRTAMKHMMS
jgi:hypothetical protein